MQSVPHYLLPFEILFICQECCLHDSLQESEYKLASITIYIRRKYGAWAVVSIHMNICLAYEVEEV